MKVPDIDLDLDERPAKKRVASARAPQKRKRWESMKGTPEAVDEEFNRAVRLLSQRFQAQEQKQAQRAAATQVRYICEPELIEVPSTRGPLYDGLMEAWTIMALLPDRSGGTKIARAVTKADAECLCRLLNGEKPK